MTTTTYTENSRTYLNVSSEETFEYDKEGRENEREGRTREAKCQNNRSQNNHRLEVRDMKKNIDEEKDGDSDEDDYEDKFGKGEKEENMENNNIEEDSDSENYNIEDKNKEMNKDNDKEMNSENKLDNNEEVGRENGQEKYREEKFENEKESKKERDKEDSDKDKKNQSSCNMQLLSDQRDQNGAGTRRSSDVNVELNVKDGEVNGNERPDDAGGKLNNGILVISNIEEDQFSVTNRQSDSDLDETEYRSIEHDRNLEVFVEKYRLEIDICRDLFEFSCDVSRLVNVMCQGYRNTDIFLKELITNSFAALKAREIVCLREEREYEELEVKIIIDAPAQCLIVEDNGIGMTKREVIKKLGMMQPWMENRINNLDRNYRSIGEYLAFGFFSAYLVSDRVVVQTKHESDLQLVWDWLDPTTNLYEVRHDTCGQPIAQGTRVTCHLTPANHSLLSRSRVASAVRKHVTLKSYPIVLMVDGVEELSVEEKRMQEYEETQFLKYLFVHDKSAVEMGELSEELGETSGEMYEIKGAAREVEEPCFPAPTKKMVISRGVSQKPPSRPVKTMLFS